MMLAMLFMNGNLIRSFRSLGAAMAYADEEIIDNVMIQHGKDTYHRTNGRWDK